MIPDEAVRREVRTIYSALADGEWIPVKRRSVDAEGRTNVVEIPGRPAELEVAPEALRREEGTIASISLAGQDVAVKVLDLPDAEGLVAVQSRRLERDEILSAGIPDPGPYGIAVAADTIITTRRLDVRFGNYVEIFRQEPNLAGYILNSLFIATLTIVGNVLSCAVVGYAFARIRFPGRDALFIIVLATMMLPAQVTMIPLFVGWVKVGALDTYVPLTLPAFLAHSAFFIFLYRQFFLTLPEELEEAARVDGCGPLRRFWNIAFPLAKPAAVAVAVYSFMASWNDFLGPLLYLTSEERQPLALALYGFKTSFGAKQAHFVLAASTLMTAPTVILFLVAQRVFMRGVVVTGVKG